MAMKLKGIYKIGYRPDEAPDKSKPWCIYNVDTGDINGRWHTTASSAEDQLKAMYSSMGDKAVKRMNAELNEIFLFADLRNFAETGRAKWIDGTTQMWVQQYPFDSWNHPLWGTTTIGKDEASRLKDSFDQGVRGQKIFADYEHGLDKAKGSKAAGEIKELKIVEEPGGLFEKPGLWARVAFTEEAKNEIDSGGWNYWSTSHFNKWTHPQLGEEYELVYNGGGLTNQPWVKGMVPLNFSELGVEDDLKEFAALTAAARKNLPDGAFMYIAPDGTRMFPYKHADGSLDQGHLEKIVQLAPRADVPDDVKNRVINKAKRLLGAKNYSEQQLQLIDVVLGQFPSERVMEEAELIEIMPIEGGEEVELENQLRELLGLDGNANIVETVKDMNDELTPMREALQQHNQQKAFSEAYPEQARELERLKAESDRNNAKLFSESFANTRLKKQDGETEVATTMGFSGLVIQKLEEMAKAFSEGNSSLDLVRELMDSIQSNGIVDYGTTGSSREDPELERQHTEEHVVNTGNMAEVRKAFSEKVTEIMKKDSIDYPAALKLAADQNPKLAEAYHAKGMDR